MANVTYEDVTPSIVPNTTMKKNYYNGVFRSYSITPNNGYVLHSKGRDWTEIDEITGEEVYRLGYSASTATCGYNYDFTTRIVTDENGVTHTAYGSSEFFARPASEVPTDQIFTVGGNDHEVM